MSIEQLLIFLVAFTIVFLQALPRLIKRRRAWTEQHEEPTSELEEKRSFEPPFEAPELTWQHAAELPFEPPEPVPIHRPPPEAPIARRVEPQPAISHRAKPQPPKAQRASVGPLVPRDRPSLRRAILLTAILGPPRSLDPPERRA